LYQIMLLFFNLFLTFNTSGPRTKTNGRKNRIT